jgi:hypothetical protein
MHAVVTLRQPDAERAIAVAPRWTAPSVTRVSLQCHHSLVQRKAIERGIMAKRSASSYNSAEF